MPTPEEIQTSINALTTSSTQENFAVLAGQAREANTGLSFSVATVNDLPDLSTADIGDGQVIFVESIGVPVMSFNVEWIGLDGRILRRDADYTQLFLWGNGSFNIPLNGVGVNRSSPSREFTLSTNWCSISFSTVSVAAVKTDGTLWSWGQNSCGVLGDGTIVEKSSPVQEFCSATNWCSVSLGFRSSVAIKTDGTLWAWGGYGFIGDGSVTSKCSPVQEFCSTTNWCAGATGRSHRIGLKTDGTIWTWGSNNCGQMGNYFVQSTSPVQEITSSTNWCAISTLSNTSMAIKTNGTLWSWGQGVCGALADNNTLSRSSPVQEISSSTNWSQVSVSNTSGSAIKTDGTVWSWGQNNCGQIGDGTLIDKSSPVQEMSSSTNWCQVSVGPSHLTTLKTDGTLWAWGSNQCGKLGDGTVAARTSPVQEITLSTDWFTSSAGNTNSGAIKRFLKPL